MHANWMRAVMGKTNETKKKIVKLLRKKNMTVTELSRELGLSTATVDQHMEELASMGLVAKQENEHFKKLKYYRLTDMKDGKTEDSGIKMTKYMLGVIVLLGFLAVLSYYYISIGNGGALRKAAAPVASNVYPANAKETGNQTPTSSKTANATETISGSNLSAQANVILPSAILASCPMIDYHLGGAITSYSNFTLYNRTTSKSTIVPDYVIGKNETFGNMSIGMLNAEEYVSNVLMQQGNGYNNVLFYNRTHYAIITPANTPGNLASMLNITFSPKTYNALENSTIRFTMHVNPKNSYNGTYMVRIDGPCLGGIGPILVTIGSTPFEGNIIQPASIYS